MTTDQHTDLETAVDTLRKGGIILYPTDTVWGLGCDARNDRAVARLFELKRRPDSKAMLLLCSELVMAEKYVERIPDKARQLLENLTRPTTVIYDGAHGVSPRLIAPDGSIGIRIPDYLFCQQLCQRLGGPVVSTSANFTGEHPAHTFSEIDSQIISCADYVCHTGRDNPDALPSDIVRLNADGSLTHLRTLKVD